MLIPQAPVIPQLFVSKSTMNELLHDLHDRILKEMPFIDRIAVAIYDQAVDTLKTFINSTRKGEMLTYYEFKLSESPSLFKISKSGEARIINRIRDSIHSESLHSQWLIKQGYQSSLTLPMYNNDDFIGFIFFDSMQASAFSNEMHQDLSLYSSIINMSVAIELCEVKSIIAFSKVARDFAELRDFETGTHLERMSRYSRVIAKAIGSKYKLTDEYIEHVMLFAPLHDIGKVGIPDNILQKPGKLNAEERVIMESHVIKGCEILQKTLGYLSQNQTVISSIIMNIVYASVATSLIFQAHSV